jgi:hypothetical protein
MPDEGPLLALLFPPGPIPAPSRDAHGIDLGAPPEPPKIEPSPEILATLKRLLSAEAALRRAVREIGLEAVVQQLVEGHGRQAVVAAVKTKGRPPHTAAYHAARHGLALACERHGCRGDRAAADQLRRFFPNRYGEQRSTDAIYRRLKEARRQCAADPTLRSTAEHLADVYLKDARGKPLPEVLRALTRRWTKSTPF